MVSRSKLKQDLIKNSLQKKYRNTKVLEDEFMKFCLTQSSNKEYHKQNVWQEHPDYQKLIVLQEAAKSQSIFNPFFRVYEGHPSATIKINNETYINYASYNYLGMNGHPEVSQAAINAIHMQGTSVSASRIVSGERLIHSQLESAIAEIYQADDALVFVSGYATNVSVIGYLFNHRDLVLHDEFIHNSALVGTKLSGAKRMSFPHNNLDSLQELLNQHRENYERVVILIEGLYSMDGDYPDLHRLIKIKNRYQALLMIDEAHSLGVMGKTGRGIAEHFHIAPQEIDIWMGTLSKSLASCGGYIAGSKTLIDLLRYFAPGFLYSVGMAPQVAAPALTALRIINREPERVSKLQENAGYFLSEAKKNNLNTGVATGFAVIPIIIGSSLKAAKISNDLLKFGINVQPILYPAVPERQARLRFFISCEHSFSQIDKTIESLINLLSEY